MKRTIVFDNDGTLYTVPEEFEGEVGRRMCSFLASKLCIPVEEVSGLRKRLRAEHKIDSTYLAFSHVCDLDFDEFVNKTFLSVDPADFIGQDSRLIELLSSLDARKIILTNNPAEFARGIITTLGVAPFFETILGEGEVGFKHKPDPYAFECADRFCVGEKFIVEDSRRNLIAASKLGYKTIQVGEPKPDPLIDKSDSDFTPNYKIDEIYNLELK